MIFDFLGRHAFLAILAIFEASPMPWRIRALATSLPYSLMESLGSSSSSTSVVTSVRALAKATIAKIFLSAGSGPKIW